MLSFLCLCLAHSAVSFCFPAWEGLLMITTWKEVTYVVWSSSDFNFALIFCLNSILIGYSQVPATKAAAWRFISRVYVDVLLLPWVFVLSYLEIKGPLPDNMSSKVLLHCIKSGGSDRCFLSCSSDVQVFSGKSKPTKTSTWFCREC